MKIPSRQSCLFASPVLLTLGLLLLPSAAHPADVVDPEEPSPLALEAKYRAESAQRRAKVQRTIYEHVIQRQGILSKGTDFFETGKVHEKIKQQKREAMARINALRAKGEVDSPDYWKAQEDFHKLQAIDYRNLSSGIDRRFNNYDNAWFGSYAVQEGINGCWDDSVKIVKEVWAKKYDLLKTLLEKGASEALKSLIFETIDATYKVRFVEYAQKEYGATPRIAEYWWNHLIMGNFKKSKTMELIEECVGKGTEKLQEKLEEGVKKEASDALKKKLAETGQKMAEEEVKKKAEESAKNWIKNLVTAPAILIEFTAKYWNVADFNLMFNEAAPNEKGFLEEIKRVLTELGKLSEAEINKCYFDRKYFLSLREQVTKGKVELPKPPPSQKKPKPVQPEEPKGVKIRVKVETEPALDRVWEYVDAYAKAEDDVARIADNPPRAFDDAQFRALIRGAEACLRADATDYAQFVDSVIEVNQLCQQARETWLRASIAEAPKQRESLERQSEVSADQFARYSNGLRGEVTRDLEAYRQQIEAVKAPDTAARLEKLAKELTAKRAVLYDECEARSMALIGKTLLAPNREYQNSELDQLIPAIERSWVYGSIAQPNKAIHTYYLNHAANGYIHPTVVVLMMGEWFAKSVYDFWYTGHSGHQVILADIQDRSDALNNLLYPEAQRWRVWNMDGTLVDGVKKTVDRFESRARRMQVLAGYKAFADREEWVHQLLQKWEVARDRSVAIIKSQQDWLEPYTAALVEADTRLLEEGEALAADGVRQWKDLCRSEVKLLADLTAARITVDEFEKEARQQVKKRDLIRAEQIEFAEMQSLANEFRREVEGRAGSFFFLIADSYQAYFSKYTVPERAVFTNIAAALPPAKKALEVRPKVTSMEDRIHAIYQHPEEWDVWQNIAWNPEAFPLQLERHMWSNLMRNAGWEDADGLLSFAGKVRKGLEARDEMLRRAGERYGAFEKKLDQALAAASISTETYQLLDQEFWELGNALQPEFWELAGQKKSHRPFPMFRYDNDLNALTKRVNDKRTKVIQKLNAQKEKPESKTVVTSDATPVPTKTKIPEEKTADEDSDTKVSPQNQAAYDEYIAAYNRLTSLMAAGKGDSPEAEKAYADYKRSREIYEKLEAKSKSSERH